MSTDFSGNFEPSLAVVEVPASSYGEEPGEASTIARAVERLASDLGWAEEGKGPFGKLIPFRTFT